MAVRVTLHQFRMLRDQTRAAHVTSDTRFLVATPAGNDPGAGAGQLGHLVVRPTLDGDGRAARAVQVDGGSWGQPR